MPSVQSCAHEAHVSPGSQAPLPQQVAPPQQGPQSSAQVAQVSPSPQTPSPQVAPPLLDDEVDEDALLEDEAPPAPPLLEAPPPLLDAPAPPFPPALSPPPQPLAGATDAASARAASRTSDLVGWESLGARTPHGITAARRLRVAWTSCRRSRAESVRTSSLERPRRRLLSWRSNPL